MGGLERSDGGIGADYGVGTIVWVRRRNGSWWPGRILGPEELSASHVMSPRSGTPVKLLGREDASVDWYNLEKSKRVKAFRCGEFDACIERAEASQGIPIKKREKYARREDAILHALELEKQQLEMKKQQLGTLSNGTNKKISGSRKRELHDFSSDLYIRKGHPRTHAKSAGKKSQMIPSKVNLPVGEEIYVHKQRSGKQVSLEENVLGDMPRMRGLQDFGLKIFPSKRNISQAVTDETSRKSVDNHVEVLSGAGLRTDSVCHVGGSTNIILSKNKRSQGSMIKESLVERSDRRCPPAQVLHRSAKLPVSQSDDKVGLVTIQSEADPLGSMSQAKRSRCIYFPSNSSDSLDQLGNSLEQTPIAEPQFEMDSLGEECTSSIMVESSNSDSSETDYLEPDMAEDANLATGSTLRLVPVSENSVGHLDCDPSGDEVAQVSGEINNHSIHLSGDIPEMHHPQEMTDALSSKGVSKWHMKGKRNIRHATKRHMDATDEKILSSSTSKWNDSVRSTTFAGKRSYSKVGNSDFPMQDTLDQGLCMKKGKTNSAYDDVDLFGNDSGHAQTLGSQRHPLAFKTAKDQVRNHSGFNDSDNASNTMPSLGWEADGLHHAPQRVCWDESYEHLESTYADHCTDEWEPKLVDVNLKVQASNYQGEHVPLVSMMSRLNGKAIVGHPVQIETLEDGSIGSLLFRSDALHDGATTPPVWRTGRRTAMQRVPRINPMTSALEDEGIELHNYPVCENKRPPMKAYSGHFSHQVILSKKSISRVRRSASKKVQQKLSKKLNLSNQKTRTLSSIATEHKLVGDKVDAKSLRRNKLLGGLIKSGVAMPLVTCVPVKVAFSRIMEAIGRPPYATAHRIRMTNSAVKNPSGS